MTVDSLTPDVDPESEMQLLYKPEDTPATLAAKKSYLGRVYLDWAQYPITEIEPVDNGQRGYIVRFKDLRFDYPERRSVLSASVELDRNLKVVALDFGTRRQRAPD